MQRCNLGQCAANTRGGRNAVFRSQCRHRGVGSVAWPPGLTSLVKIELATVVVRFPLQQSPTEQSDGRVHPPVLSKARSAHCAAQPPLREPVTVMPRAREQPQLVCTTDARSSEVGCKNKKHCAGPKKGSKPKTNDHSTLLFCCMRQCLDTSKARPVHDVAAGHGASSCNSALSPTR
jgi:hypothetical protein